MTRDTDILARTICGEARSEGQEGMEAVACVIMNRSRIAAAYFAKRGKPHPLFGDGFPATACLAPWQFSTWNKGDPNRAIIEALNTDKSIFRQAMNIAEDAVAGMLEDTTNGATHYYATSMKTPPIWAQGKTPCAVIGRHLFFKDV